MKNKIKLAIILGLEFVAIAIVLVLIFFSGKKQYTVIFDIEDGTLLSGNLEQHVTQGQNATPPSVVKDGHYLRGWSGDYRKITHNIKLHAIWEYVTTPGIVYNEIEGATYTEISDCYELLSGKVYVGAYHNELKVLAITDEAFKDCSKITEVNLLDGILGIGKQAFAGCSEMVKIELPDTTVKIDEEAFKDCAKLESITLPESLEELGANAFMGCTSLVEVKIPSTIKTISENAFEGCTSLKNVTFYEVEKEEDIFDEEDEDNKDNQLNQETFPIEPFLVISKNAFANCTALENINLPDTLHTLQSRAFSGCSSLRKIVIPKNTKNIDDNVFDTSATTVYVYIESADKIPQDWDSNWATESVTVSYGYTEESLKAPDTETED